MVWLRRMFIVFSISACVPTSVGQTASLGTISFSTVPIPAPLQSALPNKTVNGVFNTVQESGEWISQPNDQLVSALQSQYALVSASPVAEQFAQLSAIVSESQSTVQKRGVVIALAPVYYAAVFTMIVIAALAKAVKFQSGVSVSSPGSLLQDLQGSPSVIVANVNGEAFSVTVSSQAPTATAAATASSAASSSTTPWPCAGTSCRSSNDLPTKTPYTCNLAGRSGDACALVYTDMFSYNVSGTSYSLGIASLTLALAGYSIMAANPFTTLAPTACQMTAAASMCQSQSVCLCSGMYTLPRTATLSGGQTSTDCSYDTMPTEFSCPAEKSCAVGWNAQNSPYCTCGSDQIPMTVGETCGTTTVPPPTTVAPSTTPAATSSMAAPPPPPPPTMGALVCTPWLHSYGSCHKDMDVSKLNDTAKWLVQNQLPGIMTSRSPNYTEVYKAGSGVSYIANVGWIPGCTQYASQNPAYPSGNTNDEDWTYNIIYWNWLHCTGNQGLAGYTDFGCLRIGTFPTRLSGIQTLPPSPSVYWNDQSYC